MPLDLLFDFVFRLFVTLVSLEFSILDVSRETLDLSEDKILFIQFSVTCL